MGQQGLVLARHRRAKGGLAGSITRLGRGGDIIEFIKIERGCSFIEALDFAAQFVSGLRMASSSRPPRPTPRQTVDDDDDEKRIEQALGIWSETRPLRGTLAETYLRSRCIEVPDAGARGFAISSGLPVARATASRHWWRWCATSSRTSRSASTARR